MTTLNLEQYLKRIQLTDTPKKTEAGLYQLQSSQVRNIPFENIDCFLHREIHTDLEKLQTKIFTNKRGGYCFELNGIFSHVLEALDFESRPLLARVMYRGTGINSRTHIIILVNLNGREYIADVGFGGPGTYYPIPFEIGREDVQSHGVFRIMKDEVHGFLMQKKTESNDWFNIYAFNLDTVYPADLLMSNFFTSTYPESHFRHNLILARHLSNGRITLLNKNLTRVEDGVSTLREIENNEELKKIIAEQFGIQLEEAFNFSKLF